MTTDPLSLPRTFRPLGVRIAAATAACSLVSLVVVLWLLLSDEVQETFSTLQRVTLVIVFAVMVVVLYGLFRTSARASTQGLTVVNGFRTRRFDWAQIVRVSLSRNRPWALVDLDDGSTQSVMAIQSSDGERATRAASDLAQILARQNATERDD
jgi:hypothetical protein